MPDKSKNQDEVLFSVCIATYKRTALLEKLLFSLTKQILPPAAKLEIVVTDNDSEASAAFGSAQVSKYTKHMFQILRSAF